MGRACYYYLYSIRQRFMTLLYDVTSQSQVSSELEVPTKVIDSNLCLVHGCLSIRVGWLLQRCILSIAWNFLLHVAVHPVSRHI